MIFGRNRNVRHEQITLPEELMDERDKVAAGLVASGESTDGPYDVKDRDTTEGYIDLGAVRVRAIKSMELRLDLEDKTKEVVAVTVKLGSSSLQVQAFAAPRRTGVWDELREDLSTTLGKTPGATVVEREGRFGTEVLGRMPAQMPDGSPGWTTLRFLGVDGPRWFARGLIRGEAARSPEDSESLEQVFADLVIVRGDAPMAPRDLLPLHPPKNVKPVRRRRPGREAASGDAAQAPGQSASNRREGAPEQTARPAPELPERGPEITEIR